MDSAPSDKQSADAPGTATDAPTYLPGGTAQTLVKVVIAGPFGVGKTTLIRALSEIRPLHTEELLTEAGELVDDLSGVRDKTTTTVAIDFGRRTLPGDLVLYLYGTPGQRRFKPLWEDIARGALGALVLVDTRRLGDSFEVIDMIEEQGLTYAVAVNSFPDSPAYEEGVLRDHLDLGPDTPLVYCDARDTSQAVDALIALVTCLLSELPQEAVAP
ncbi:ATP/GTP-binding protein [Streptomyces sp. NPDC127033]|uniref:GTP-binding protein n=1 Tax=Streptomyces sp. NPDC127033 TaxID=3347110 RepID=UPI0036479952